MKNFEVRCELTSQMWTNQSHTTQQQQQEEEEEEQEEEEEEEEEQEQEQQQQQQQTPNTTNTTTVAAARIQAHKYAHIWTSKQYWEIYQKLQLLRNFSTQY